MPKTIMFENSTDMQIRKAAQLFASLNKEYVQLVVPDRNDLNQEVFLVSQVDPNDERMIYPYGWYFALGQFRNKHFSSTGLYSEMPMRKSDGTSWCSEKVITPPMMEEILPNL